MGCLPCFKGWKFSLLVSQSMPAGFLTQSWRVSMPEHSFSGDTRGNRLCSSLGCLSSGLRCASYRTALPTRCSPFRNGPVHIQGLTSVRTDDAHTGWSSCICKFWRARVGYLIACSP